MSAEVVKKRGRPKKVVADTTDPELPEIVSKTSTRASSTRTAAAKPTSKPAKTSVKPKAVKPAKASPKIAPKKDASVEEVARSIGKKESQSATKKIAPKAAPTAKKTTAPVLEKAESKAKNTTVPKSSSGLVFTPDAISSDVPKSSAETPAPLKVKEDVQQQKASLRTAPKSDTVLTVTPATSEILSKVRELSQQTSTTIQVPISKTSKPSTISHAPRTLSSTKPTSSAELPTLVKPMSPHTIVKMNPVSKVSAPAPSKPTIPAVNPKSSQKPQASPTVKATPKPPPKPRIPIAALNKEIVSNISARAGARPNPTGSGGLPPGYKPAARKVTMTIVALPIAIVTSYVLYQRLVLGQDKKELVKPGLTAVQTTEDTTVGVRTSTIKSTSKSPGIAGQISAAAGLAERGPVSKTLHVTPEPSLAATEHNAKNS